MTRRCHLCGREGTRGYLEAIACLLVGTYGPLHVRQRLEERLVTICAARRACNQRRGLPT